MIDREFGMFYKSRQSNLDAAFTWKRSKSANDLCNEKVVYEYITQLPREFRRLGLSNNINQLTLTSLPRYLL